MVRCDSRLNRQNLPHYDQQFWIDRNRVSTISFLFLLWLSVVVVHSAKRSLTERATTMLANIRDGYEVMSAIHRPHNHWLKCCVKLAALCRESYPQKTVNA